MLRSIAKVVVALAICAPTLHAQKKVKEAKPGQVELIRLENQWTTGMVKRDAGLFDKMLSPKFIYTENDKMMTRSEVLHELTAGSDTVTAARNDGMEVDEFGGVTAAVTGWLIVEGRGKGGAFARRYRFTDTWVKRKGGWEIVAAQDYLVPK